jgi:hypothetical protein
MDNYISARELYEWAKQRAEKATNEEQKYRFEQVAELVELVTKAADESFNDDETTDNLVDFLR